MKKEAVIGMSIITLCIALMLYGNLPLIRQQRKEVGDAFPTGLDPQQKGLMEVAFGLMHPDKIDTILKDAVQQFGFNKEKFFKFIMTGDLEGWTILHHYVVDGNAEHVRIILETVRDVLDDPYLFEQFVNAKDKFSTTALLIGVQRYKTDTVKELITIVGDELKDNPDLFFDFLMVTGSETGHTPLTFAILQNKYQLVELLVCAAAAVFGVGSQYLDAFLNTPDDTGKTGYTYAPHAIQEFLLRYGARGKDYIGELY